MKRYLLIGCGGFLGAFCRGAVKSLDWPATFGSFPLATLLINLSGSFILAFILTVTLELWQADPDFRNALTVGFCGSFTTFSTFTKELFHLLSLGKLVQAGLYLGLSIAIGLLMSLAGIYLANLLAERHVEKPRMLEKEAKE
ncbi:MAG: CrcB family protein [Spirochaetia bacterium]|jgi:CrcB protein|nr:CrcB family protein [Spirochaetia bacterium]